ncbi:thiopeptide-type bacteriocin biosynthesis protein [Streptomyces dysideae]|uniref:thiopeptide-type bacteriocin biosynthesis protein n=1 Tax=Streptomyces dysideae TaxID=909626 RepID=UPI00131D7ECE|nr:thiopeptide-type bacteriocin biosynthesis protein [Streptomyces dysideae]
MAYGHANTGMAHGIGGVLALLALAAWNGSVIDGHHAALRTILTWLDRWKEKADGGPVWPYWVTQGELRRGRLGSSAPRRPSWCYGTAGLARAQQLAALALGDTSRQIDAENALVAALTDPEQLKATTDNGLCHGFAGLAHAAARTADDAHPSTAGKLRAAIPALLAAVTPPDTDPELTATVLIQDEQGGPGLLDGVAMSCLPCVYEPETDTFGGPEAMDAAHELFHSDSRHLLTYQPSSAHLGRRETAVLLASVMMRGAGLDCPALCIAPLRWHRMRQAAARAKAGEQWQKSGYVLTTRTGRQVEPRNVYRSFTRVAESAGLRVIRLHDARHGTATLLTAAGVAPRVVMEILGHSQISITMDVYTHVVQDTQREAMSPMDRLLRRRPGRQ